MGSGDKGFDDGIRDVPFGKDLYYEAIPEMGSSYEASSYKGGPKNTLGNSMRGKGSQHHSVDSGTIDSFAYRDPYKSNANKSKKETFISIDVLD